MRPPVEHVIRGIEIEPRRANTGPAVAASCTCSWRGPNRYGLMGTARARADGVDHIADMAGRVRTRLNAGQVP